MPEKVSRHNPQLYVRQNSCPQCNSWVCRHWYSRAQECCAAKKTSLEIRQNIPQGVHIISLFYCPFSLFFIACGASTVLETSRGSVRPYQTRNVRGNMNGLYSPSQCVEHDGFANSFVVHVSKTSQVVWSVRDAVYLPWCLI